MTLLVFALWSPRALTGQAFRDELTGAGVASLQINVVDDAVADGQLRISTYDEPVEAFTVVTGGDPSAISKVMQDHCASYAGWVVDTTQPLQPPVTGDGQRTTGFANIALLRRPEELTYDEWRERWLTDHTAVAVATQATFGYTQHRVIEPLTELGSDVAAIVEELFPIEALTDFHAWYATGGGDEELGRRMTAMLESVARFGADRNLDVAPTSRYVWSL